MAINERLYFNGDILTLEDELYVEAVLVKDGKICRVGKKEDLHKELSENAELVDLEGKTLIPSFIDAHSHFSGYASGFTQVNLSECTSFEEIAESIKKFIEKNNIPEGKWIQATGYDQNFLCEKAHPTKEILDAVSPNNPVIAKQASGHMGVLNSIGIKEFGITVDTPNPEGGLIEKIEGELTGYIEESAYFEYVQKLPMISNEEFFGSLMKAQAGYASYGVTTAQEGFVVELLADVYNYLAHANMLKIDLIGYMDMSKADILKEKFAASLNKYNNHLKIGGYKTFLDGSPQGKTAWMKTPYQGEQKYCGYGTQTDQQIKSSLEIALKDNMQILVHCNGDAACQQYIDQYKAAKESTGLNNDIRPVIIHAQLLDRDQLDDVKELGMIPSFFVAHVMHWGDIHVNNFGIERAKRISIAKSTGDMGIPYTFHQDAPVIEPNMLETIHAAVNRVTKGRVLLGEEEKVSALDALKAVTKNAAFQYFEEDIKGTIAEGKLADLVILDRNPLKINTNEIKDILVLETIKEGNTIFKKII